MRLIFFVYYFIPTCIVVWCDSITSIHPEAILDLVNNHANDSLRLSSGVPPNHRADDHQLVVGKQSGGGSLPVDLFNSNLLEDRFHGYESSGDFMNSIDEQQPSNLIDQSSHMTKSSDSRWSSLGEGDGFAPVTGPIWPKTDLSTPSKKFRETESNKSQAPAAAAESTVQFDDDEIHNNSQTEETSGAGAGAGWTKKVPKSAGAIATQSRSGDQRTDKSPSSLSPATAAVAADAEDDDDDDDSSIKSLAQANKALEDNLALHDRLKLLLDKVKPIRANNMREIVMSNSDSIRDPTHLAGHTNLIPTVTNTSRNNNNTDIYPHHHEMATTTTTTTTKKHLAKKQPDDEQLLRSVDSRGFNPIGSDLVRTNIKTDTVAPISGGGRLSAATAAALIPEVGVTGLRFGGRSRSRGLLHPTALTGGSTGASLVLVAAPSSQLPDSAPVTSAADNSLATSAGPVTRFSPRENQSGVDLDPSRPVSTLSASSQLPADSTDIASRSAHADKGNLDLQQQYFEQQRSQLTPAHYSRLPAPLLYEPAESGSVAAEDDDEQTDEWTERDGFYQAQQLPQRQHRHQHQRAPPRQLIALDQLSGASGRHNSRKQGQRRPDVQQADDSIGQPGFERSNPRRNNGIRPSLARPLLMSNGGGGTGKITATRGKKAPPLALNKYATSDDDNWFYDYPTQMTSLSSLSMPQQQQQQQSHKRRRQSALHVNRQRPLSSLSAAAAAVIPGADYNPGPEWISAVNPIYSGNDGNRFHYPSSSSSTDHQAALSTRVSLPLATGDFREDQAAPSYQVVHIHSKDKKSHGKYLWPIVGGGLTMLMGFLIISNILLSIPLLAIGASSLFNHQGGGLGSNVWSHSQQLVPVYNLSALITTRSPTSGAGRRRRRRRRKRAAGGRGGSRCAQNEANLEQSLEAERLAAGLWLLARRL